MSQLRRNIFELSYQTSSECMQLTRYLLELMESGSYNKPCESLTLYCSQTKGTQMLQCGCPLVPALHSNKGPYDWQKSQGEDDGFQKGSQEMAALCLVH